MAWEFFSHIYIHLREPLKIIHKLGSFTNFEFFHEIEITGSQLTIVECSYTDLDLSIISPNTYKAL